MRAHLTAFGAGLLGALFFAVALNTPAAYAQAMATGISVDVLTALVGKNVVASTVTVTVTSGAGITCNSALASCMKGPGAHASYGFNGSGELLLGPAGDTSTVARIGEMTIRGNNQIEVNNGAIDCNGSCVFRNNSGPVRLSSTLGYETGVVSSLATCASGIRTRVVTLQGAFDDRVCQCSRLADGATYAWINTRSGTVGDDTTCAP
jgi:xanthosine utilization system XapX-like protein